MTRYKHITPSHIKPVLDEIYVGENIISQQACEELISSFSPKCKAGNTIGYSPDHRNNLCTIADKSHPIIGEIKKYCSQITKTNQIFQEEVQFIKYEPGMYYKEHYDFFENPRSTIPGRFGTQRLYSFLFYLNKGERGGETRFPKFKISFKPEPGKMLMWKNIKGNELNYNVLHESKATQNWTKYAIVLWIRT